VAASARRWPDRLSVRRRSHYTMWAFAWRLRAAGVLGSMGSIGECYYNQPSRERLLHLQLELLDSTTGRVVVSWRSPCSSGSRPGTTRAAVTPRSVTSAQSTSEAPTFPPQLRHDNHHPSRPAKRGSSASNIRSSRLPIAVGKVRESSQPQMLRTRPVHTSRHQ